MRFGVVCFPGTNCEQETFHVLQEVLGQPVELVWHREEDLSRFDCMILPGGFSYGDYLRCGAMARFSPIMGSVRKFARQGKLVFGICNGFQILLEAGLLPGVTLQNRSLKYVSRDVYLRIDAAGTPFTNRFRNGEVIRIPIAHYEGNYFADPETIDCLERERRILFRYCEPDGQVTEKGNPNGSLHGIAGICNEGRNVLGMMPHPERASEVILGNDQGRKVFESLIAASLGRDAAAVGNRS